MVILVSTIYISLFEFFDLFSAYKIFSWTQDRRGWGSGGKELKVQRKRATTSDLMLMGPTMLWCLSGWCLQCALLSSTAKHCDSQWGLFIASGLRSADDTLCFLLCPLPASQWSPGWHSDLWTCGDPLKETPPFFHHFFFHVVFSLFVKISGQAFNWGSCLIFSTLPKGYTWLLSVPTKKCLQKHKSLPPQSTAELTSTTLSCFLILHECVGSRVHCKVIFLNESLWSAPWGDQRLADPGGWDSQHLGFLAVGLDLGSRKIRKISLNILFCSLVGDWYAFLSWEIATVIKVDEIYKSLLYINDMNHYKWICLLRTNYRLQIKRGT